MSRPSLAALILVSALACGRAVEDWDSCVAPPDCVVVSGECCGGEYEDHSWVAVRRDRADAWNAEACAHRDPAGPGCILFCASQALYPIATCERSVCVSVVPASQPWNECVADTDCVALPRDCTDDGPPDACEWPRAYFVGVARDHEREYTLAICGAGRDLPAFGGSVAARCNAGRCEVRAAR